MTSSASLAARSSAVSFTSLQQQPDPNPHTDTRNHRSDSNNNDNSNSNSNSLSFSSDNSVLHAHRQNHNSSKLPAFRFADLKKDRISLPSLHQPAPLAPVVSQTTADPVSRQTAHKQTGHTPDPAHNSLHHSSSTQTLPARPASFEIQKTSGASRTRSLKFHLASSSASVDPSTGSKRPASFPETHRAIDGSSALRSQSSYAASPATNRRSTEGKPQGSSAQGETQLGETAKSDDRTSRPPLSYKLLSAAADAPGSRVVIPPIRSFRSSGSRKSQVLDMPGRRASEDLADEEPPNPSQRNRALRTLEGRGEDDFSHLAPPDSGEMTTTTDNDNTADIFMKIAREDTAERPPEKPAAAAEPSTISRIVRTAHRRPLSAAIPSHDVPSPPRVSRRLSDQRDNSRARQATESQPGQHTPHELAYRTAGRENLPPISTTADGASRGQPVRTPLRPSPITPRQISFKDSFAESSSAYQRRRQSLTEGNSLPSSRVAQYRSSNLSAAQARTYHSSPLVPKSANVQTDGLQHGTEGNHGVEGTESSSSTAPPSTVWDELDDLKSRIHRLELTGKMPPSSGATASRSSDERPRTATTNATTVSASPKRASGVGSAQADKNDHASQPREAQPLLLSALSKTKSVVSPDVFSSLESAATDALALSSMIGGPGQPGPISSGASSIGVYNGHVTDRQLRRKADSICRSLTELCIALAESTIQQKHPQATDTQPEKEPRANPESAKAAASVLTPQMRPSAIAETMSKAHTSPRSTTTLEQKRQAMLASISVASSRYATAPSTPQEPSPGRKSSLLLSRIRRTATEEPEEAPQPGRRSSLLLRTRRTGTEEMEDGREGRKTSLLLRTRKTMNEEEDESRSRVPSRAITEVNSARAVQRDLGMTAMTTQPVPDPGSTASSALPRRRLPSAISTRLATTSVPVASSPITPSRRYLERGLLQERSTLQERGTYIERGTQQERGPVNHLAERIAEERARQYSLSQAQGVLLSRTSSIGRRTRESGIPSPRS